MSFAFRFAACLSAAALLAGCSTDAPPERSAAARPLTLDTHIDIPLDYATAATDPLTADLQVNLAKMAAGGLDAGFFIVFVGQTARTDEGYARAQADALTKFAAIHRMTEELYPERVAIAYSAGDVPRIVASGKLAAAIGIENGYSLGRISRCSTVTTRSGRATWGSCTTATTISRARRGRAPSSAIRPSPRAT